MKIIKKGIKTVEEEIRIRLEQLLAKLNRNIEIATINFNNTRDTRIHDMRDRWVNFRNILNNIHTNSDLTLLATFANETFNNIDWDNSEQNARDINFDSQEILLDILNLLPAVERTQVNPQNQQDRFRLISEIIHERIEIIMNEQE